jgi:tetratricopeptide (TPR) repeat protein
MSQRLTRKEIKRDQIGEWLEHSATAVKSHRRGIVVAVVAVVAAAALAGGGFWWLATQAARANEQLARATKVYAAPIEAVPKPDDPDAPSFADEASRRARAEELFEELRSGHPWADAADLAEVYLGRIAVDQGDLDGAAERWRRFIDDHPDHVLAGEVRVNLLAVGRQQGKAAEVAAELEGMLAQGPDERPLPGDVILFELAQTYEQLGRDDDAKSTYGRLVEEHPQSPYTAAARQKAGPAAQLQAQALAGLGS